MIILSILLYLSGIYIATSKYNLVWEVLCWPVMWLVDIIKMFIEREEL